MSEASDNLTAAVTRVAQNFEMLNTSLQSELQQISNALNTAGGDEALRTAAVEAVSRLEMVASQLEHMNGTVQGIIPDPQP